MRSFVLAAVAATILAGCAAGSSLTGTVSSPGVDGFGPEASAVQVSLVEQSSGRVVTSETVLIEGRSSVAFRLKPSAPADGALDLRARVIDRAGAVLYRSDGDVPVDLASDGDVVVTVAPARAGG